MNIDQRRSCLVVGIDLPSVYGATLYTLPETLGKSGADHPSLRAERATLHTDPETGSRTVDAGLDHPSLRRVLAELSTLHKGLKTPEVGCCLGALSWAAQTSHRPKE